MVYSCVVRVQECFSRFPMSGKKLSALFLNLIAPGVGHWALGAKRRAAMYMAFAGVCVFWALARIGTVFLNQMLNPPAENAVWPNFVESAKNIGVAFGWPMLALILLWTVNYADLFFTSVPVDAAGKNGKKRADADDGDGGGR